LSFDCLIFSLAIVEIRTKPQQPEVAFVIIRDTDGFEREGEALLAHPIFQSGPSKGGSKNRGGKFKRKVSTNASVKKLESEKDGAGEEGSSKKKWRSGLKGVLRGLRVGGKRDDHVYKFTAASAAPGDPPLKVRDQVLGVKGVSYRAVDIISKTEVTVTLLFTSRAGRKRFMSLFAKFFKSGMKVQMQGLRAVVAVVSVSLCVVDVNSW